LSQRGIAAEQHSGDNINSPHCQIRPRRVTDLFPADQPPDFLRN